jgi:hypothetical protein
LADLAAVGPPANFVSPPSLVCLGICNETSRLALPGAGWGPPLAAVADSALTEDKGASDEHSTTGR